MDKKIRNSSLLLLALFTVLFPALPAAARAEQASERTAMHLYYTGNTLGALEPCPS